MKNLRLAKKIIRTLLKDRLRYPGQLITDTFALTARCGVLLILYWYVFKLRGGAVNGTTYAVAAWSMFFYFAFSTLRLREISRAIMQDVQSGQVEMLLNKPISYLTYRAWWQIGAGLYSFLTATIIGGLALAWSVGIPPSMTIGIFLPTVLLVFIGASALSLAIYTLVGLLAFWIEDINPIFWMVDKTIMILGGSYLPVALFPPVMYKLSLYSPFGASQFITHTVYETWRSDWPALITIQAGWIMVFALSVGWLFNQARWKVSINGG